jgi:hypothetical protein
MIGLCVWDLWGVGPGMSAQLLRCLRRVLSVIRGP